MAEAEIPFTAGQIEQGIRNALATYPTLPSLRDIGSAGGLLEMLSIWYPDRGFAVREQIRDANGLAKFLAGGR